MRLETSAEPFHCSIGTNLDMPDSVLPLGCVKLDPDRKWTFKVKTQALHALEGRMPPANVEELDAVISRVCVPRMTQVHSSLRFRPLTVARCLIRVVVTVKMIRRSSF